jgi:carbamate kinase
MELTGDLDVVALGGNAILPSGKTGTIEEQLSITRRAMDELVVLLDKGRRVVITHGNGPIVGNIVIRNEAAKDTIPPMPLDICGADSQGGIGYMIQQALGNALAAHGAQADVVSLVTQVVVDADDPAFGRPVKPIGPFYRQDEAEALAAQRGWTIVKDSNRGYRRVVPSPKPLRIVEIDVIRRLLSAGTIVIAGGGGGVPVVERGGRLEGREAVVDKDLTAALLGGALQAERLIILTDVDAVYRDFGTPDQAPIRHASVSEVKTWIASGAFPPGSMGSKLEAVVNFLGRGGGSAVICRPENLADALEASRGTTIVS